ncbi:MAG: hypothetical protein EPN22_09075 [Nitrospirae bacterium]|nr:MAG: hypothetical protein EPN22_09075 [Nitrospirota bacterium]
MKKTILLPLLLLALLIPAFATASDETFIYPLGDAIIDAINRGEEPTDAALLLLTKELKWYEQNMGRLKPEMQHRVQQMRLRLAHGAVKKAALRTGNPIDLFGAAGSWSPGRDMDMVYFGKKGEKVKQVMTAAFDEEAAAILNAGMKNDRILLALQKQGAPIPNIISSESMCFGIFDLPDFGYGRMQTAYEQAYERALEAKRTNVDPDSVLKTLYRELEEGMLSNFEAHIATTWSGDSYRGASGQQWFKENYLQNPKKLRFLGIKAGTSELDLLEGNPLNSVAQAVVDRSGFAGLIKKTGQQPQFAKIASEFGMFWEHQHGGPSDTAKYYYRIWDALDSDILSDLSGDETMHMLLAKRIMANPDAAGTFLENAGVSVEAFRDKMSKSMAKWTERQMLRDTEQIVKEIADIRFSPKTGSLVEQIRALKASGKIKLDAMEIVTGLENIKKVKPELADRLLQSLTGKFEGSDAGQIILKYIKIQLKLLADEGGALTGRILLLLRQMNRISEEDYLAALKAKTPLEMPADVAARMKKARGEIMMIASANMTSLDDSDDMLDILLGVWKKMHTNAQIQDKSPLLLEFLSEVEKLPQEELIRNGWTVEELRQPQGVKNRLQLSPGKRKALGDKLSAKLAKKGISLQMMQEKIYEIVFSPEYTKFGDPSMSIGPSDAVIGAASAMFQTYVILNGPAMSEADESIALSNAWVTAIPVVGDFAQGLITGSEGYWEGDKGKMAEAGLWMAVGVTAMIPGGQLPAVIGSMMLALKPVAGGIYDASQAQNLVQAWIESGRWSSGKPPVLEGIYDRNGLLHRLTYDEILGAKGEVKYDSSRIKSLPFGEFTIAQSVRDYANTYVLAGNKNVDVLRENLKTLFPDLGDNILNDLSFAENKIADKKSKVGEMFFKAYERQVRGGYIQTIAHLKKWAEDERRVAKDYEGEVKRLRAELAELGKELKNATLVRHADDTVASYTKIATNLFEQESLPLSRVRIYENYLSTYKQIRDQLKAVAKLFAEASSHYVPNSWYLTGYPVFDKDITNRLTVFMARERANAEQQVVKLLKDLDQKDTYLNLQNECHKKAFDIIAAKRYKIAFMQHLVEYYNGLAGESSRWSDAYDSARRSYEGTRDSLLNADSVGADGVLVAESKPYLDAFTTFFFSMGYAIASNDSDGYRQVANSYESQLIAAGEHDKSDRTAGIFNEAGKALQQCLKTGLLIQIELSNTQPEAGSEVEASAKLVKGSPPKTTTWKWDTSGGLVVKPHYGDKTTVKADAEGVLTLRLMDERYLNKPVAETSVKIVPKTAELRILLRGPQEGEVGKSLSFGAEPSVAGPLPKDIRYEWIVDGQPAGQGRVISQKFTEPRSFGVRVNAYRMIGGKKVLFDSAQQTVVIRGLEPKKDDSAEKQKERERIEKERLRQVERERQEAERLEKERAREQAGRERLEADRREREQAEKERIESEQSAAREQKIREEQKQKVPPTCTYQYSEWGECSRATKKHIRSVTGVKPEGCVEKGKPELEQECTPPPTAKEQKEQLMDCLCRASGATRYTPDGCATCCPGNGVCSWSGSLGGFWCRHMRPDPPEKAAECYEIVYGKKANSAELSQLEKDIRDVDKNNTKPLKVTLAPDAKPIKAQYGTTVSLTAKAEGGMPGYTYSWSGNGEGKDNTFTFINTRKPGTYAVSVTVNDSDGGSATAATSIAVEAITVTIEKTSPAGNTVPVGGQASFKTTVTGATDLNYLWQPHPEVEFNPFEKSATSTATFRNPGSVGIWVDVLVKDGAVMRSAGQSNVITMQVANPQWALEFSPANPRVGQPIKAKISPAGPVAAATNTAEMNFRWQFPANAKQTGTSQDDREITFVLKDTKPANISCTAATKRKNENLGGAGKTITAQGFEVKVSGPRGRQEFQIWKCETQLGGAPVCGMKKVENQFAAGNEILFSATVEPTPEKPVSYNWTVSPSGCSIASPFSRDIGMTCSSTGSFTVKVSAKSDGMEIGSSSASVSVSISQNDISRSNKSKEAYEKLQKAKGLVSQGKLDEGIGLIDEVVKLDPKHTEAAALGPKWRSEKQTVMKHVENIKKLLLAENIVQAEKDLAAAQQLHPKLAPVVEVEKDLNEAKKKIAGKKIKEDEAKKKEQAEKDKQAQMLADEGYGLEKKGDLAGAIKKYQEVVKLVPDKEISEHITELQKKMKKQEEEARNEAALKAEQGRKDKQAQKLADEGYGLEKKGDLAGAIKKYQEVVKLVPDKEISEHITELQKKMKKQEEEARNETALKAEQGRKDKQAQKLADEGYSLEKKGDLAGAIKKYKEAVKIVPDRGTSDHIAELQTKIKEKGAQDQKKMESAEREGSENSLVDLLKRGETVSGEVQEQHGTRKGKVWSYTMRITSYDASSGTIVGEMTWLALGSINRIRGRLTGNTLEFTETEAIRAGSAHLNVSYTMKVSQNEASGSYNDHGDNSGGSAKLKGTQEKQKKTDEGKKKQDTLKQHQKDKQAQQLADEGYSLEKKGDLAGAIKKYQAAVKVVPDESTSEHIADLQKKIKEEEAKRKTQAAQKPATGYWRLTGTSGDTGFVKPGPEWSSKEDLSTPGSATYYSYLKGELIHQSNFTWTELPEIVYPGLVFPLTAQGKVVFHKDPWSVSGGLTIQFYGAMYPSYWLVGDAPRPDTGTSNKVTLDAKVPVGDPDKSKERHYLRLRFSTGTANTNPFTYIYEWIP